MASTKFKIIIILSNFIMALLMLISYQLILIQFQGHGRIILEGFWLYGGGPYPSGEPQLVSTHPTLNFPLIIFILILIADSYFLVRIRRNKNSVKFSRLSKTDL